VKSITNRIQLGLVAVGYAGALVVSAALLYRRHLVNLQDPAAASGGMAAAGDMMLQLFIGGLFLVPSALLIWMIAKFDAPYTTYSRFLFGFSLSAPVCMGMALLSDKYIAPSLSWFCFFRILQSPNILVGMGVSRFAARSDGAKRLASRALLIEGLTLGLPIAAFVIMLFLHR
jgi:hypothetical protein